MNFLRPLIAGVLHSFEPDHVSAVSVLAAENAIEKKKITLKTALTVSQWAIGHSVTLLLFGILALVFKTTLSSIVSDVSFWAELSIGPIMIWLGVVAVKRNHQINDILADHKKIQPHDHNPNTLFHLHGKKGEEIAMNPINKSFWIGMLHGLAGTGGALTSMLIISTDTIYQAIQILLIESIGIVLSMGVYTYVLIYTMSRFIERNIVVFKWINGVVGILSIIIGFYMIYNNLDLLRF